MIITGPSDHTPGVYPRAEMSMLLGAELLEAAAYPEDVLKSALTILQAHVDQDIAATEDSHAPDAAPFLLMVWIQPLAEHDEDEAEAEYEDEEATDE